MSTEEELQEVSEDLEALHEADLASLRESFMDYSMPWGGVRIEELLSRVRQGASRIDISQLHGSALAYLASRLLPATEGRPLILVCADNQRAFQLHEELCFFCGEDEQASASKIHLYTADEVLPYSEMLPDRGAIQSRLRVLIELQQGVAPIVIAPIASLVRKVIPRVELSARSELIQVAEEIDREHLIQQLVRGGYHRVPVVEDGGTFAVRGAILDIYAPLYNYPVRIELDDNLVSSIRFFDPDSQRTRGEVEELLIGPVDESLVTQETLKRARQHFADLADHLHFPTLELEQLLDDLGQGLRPFGLQRLMPGFYDSLNTFFDYLPPRTVFLFDEPQDLRYEVSGLLERLNAAYQSFVQEGGLAYEPSTFCLPWSALETQFRRFSRIEHRALFQDFAELEHYTPASTEIAEDSATPPPSHNSNLPSVAQWRKDGTLIMPFSTASHNQLRQQLRALANAEERRLQPLIERVLFWRKEGLRVVIACGSRGQAIRLQELFALYQMRAFVWKDNFHPDIDKQLGKHAEIDIFIGRISEGFLFPNARLVVLSEEEIFGPKARRQHGKKKNALSHTEIEHLRPGDLVIHRQHGLARYAGLHTLTINNITGDFLLLEYQGKDRLYLPITRLSMLERYSGGGTPVLDRLKGSTFDKKVAKARSSIQALAGSLLQLYAARKANEGEAFPSPGPDYFEFAARFPFEETPDQWRAIEDVIEDMQSERPMDRLICGDVGYGKTEVAMRAAFLAAEHGKQVAVLVPTTVLAQQHYLNFAERFEAFPIKLGIMSRFQSSKKNKETLQQLASGQIDIVVGTHRLLSRDVHFKRLGLLIIDEEHRFGVKDKERIKTLRESIDVMTMTATPIPRTLEMSITGLRDLSLITTPPHDRLAIRTSIAPYDPQIIREAVMRELERGGQIFFVHNRVESIGKIQEDLQKIVPEARTIVAHGQMPETELERAMLDFMQGKYNLLLCTSIVESGLDIHRANTILINRADTFGLAQLYQIRGRVGRGCERAYAYLLVPAHKRISPEAKERLATLQRFTELGAGFEIAKQDLEMRGAGNFLGKEQSGHVHAIGLDLYLDMLEETVSELQGKPRRKTIPTEVKVDVDTYIPDFYVPDIQLRLQCYRRISAAETPDDLDTLMQEFCDRFGEPPREVENLFILAEITQFLSAIRAMSADASGNKFRFFFPPDVSLPVEPLLELAQQKKSPIRILPQSGLELTEPLPEGSSRLNVIRTALKQLPRSIFQITITSTAQDLES